MEQYKCKKTIGTLCAMPPNIVCKYIGIKMYVVNNYNNNTTEIPFKK
jgi:hypothetical protein